LDERLGDDREREIKRGLERKKEVGRG